MASVMAIESEVFGSCVGEIDVSVEIENRDAWLCCGWKYMGFILAGKAAQDCRWKVAVVPGIGGSFRRVGSD
jgi:hypothetical protein